MLIAGGPNFDSVPLFAVDFHAILKSGGFLSVNFFGGCQFHAKLDLRPASAFWLAKQVQMRYK